MGTPTVPFWIMETVKSTPGYLRMSTGTLFLYFHLLQASLSDRESKVVRRRGKY